MIIAPDGCVNMAKPILFAAAGAVAIFYLIAPSSASYSYASSSATSSGSYASASSESFAIATSGSEYLPPPPCDTAPTPKPCRPQKPKCYSKYEVFSNCPATVCRPKKCDEVGFPVACVDLNPNEQCPVPPGCICIENYVRNHKGICIPMKNCPCCGGDRNAESGCNSICNQLCSKLNEKPVACTAECVYNSCECKKGYVFDEVKNKCVHPSHCTCKSNEVYTDCEQAKCGPKTCAQLMFPVHCLKIDPKYCTKGCICIEGYVRNKYGECIPKDQCPPICGPYEFPSNCMQADCAPQNCTQLGFPLVCVRVDQKHCKKGCLCKEGYARNSDGVCIPVKECPSCGGDCNAESAECASNCGRLCSNYDKTDVVCTLECPINGCQCKEGYVYDSNTNRCVLPCDCTPTCGPHEVYSNCMQGDCAPKNCTELGFPIACPRVDPKYCKKGCLCKPGYVRNSAGICIPVKKCPSCGGDPNAEGAECASNCGRLCSNYDKKDVVCTLECVINGCQCKEGYVYDSNTHRCVLPCDCTPTCGPHEVYNNCMQGDCAPKKCTELGFPIACPRVDPKYCKKGCLCEPGYVRNSAGVCIPVKKCPSCGGDPNAEGAECASNCGRLCSNYDKRDVVCTLECAINGCQCKKGFVYDSNTHRCVLPCDCTSVCKEYEMYSECINNPCPVINCSHVGLWVDCLQFDTKGCIKGCVCKKPLMREDDGSCVPIEECKTPVCKENEVYSDCINGGCTPKNCSQLGQPKKCVKIDPKYCIKGCLCKEGYLREDDGTCVPEKKCKKKCTKPNEYYECCGYDCPSQSCKSINKTQHCPIQTTDNCKPLCKCKDGFFRNLNGECITKKQCLQCPGPHEYWSCGGACDNVCKDMHKQNQTNCPIVNVKCNEMCYCEKNYARAKNGTCIPIKRCNEPQCRKNERYEKCPARLTEPQKCSELGWPLPDPCTDDDKCPVKPACVCISGYVRNDKGVCIPKKDCPPVCKENEVYSDCINGGCTPKNCSQLGQPKICVKIDPKYCIKGCLCKEGYLREDDGTCVPEKKCKKKCTKPNEYYECCGYDCPSQSCKSINKTQHCPIQTTDNCKPICKCKDGFFRNLNGECITKKQCLQCPGPHEYWSCGGACDNVCKDMHKQNQTNCPIVNVKCNEMCYCEKNYARAKNGTCIPIKRCNEPQCRKNERYEKCPARLTEPQKCSELGWPLPDPCTDDDKCPVKPACVCISGYVRNDKGVCIPKKDCPDCGGDPNAKPGCGINCNKKCEDLGSEPVFCITLCKENSCDCKDGYYYDKEKKKCVPPCECLCKENEVYSDCINGGCTPKNCSQLGQPKICVKIDPKYCIKGCLCKEGYLREDDGTCVPEKKCKKKCTKPNEYYECCGYDCPSQSCKSINKTQHCPIQTTDNCKPLCKCKDGFFRNLNGECITKKQCLQCPGPHEYWSCGGACDNVCKDMHKQNQTNCPIVNVKCNEMCYCEKNYARAKNGTCIPIKRCNEPQCRKNERYEKCPARLTEPQKCSELGWPLPDPCTDDDKCPVKPACVCISGYVRNDKGVCIPKKDCPDCGGDPNAKPGCGINCNKKCEDLGSEPVFCITLCKENSCDCKDGYYYDKEKKKCVPPCECPPVCKKNEVYSDCINGGCTPKNCSQLGQPKICVKIDPKYCIKGCLCKEGYLREDDGTCVPEKKCKKKCTKPNEYYECCGYDCPSQSCKSINKTQHCPIQNTDNCKPLCKCKDGFFRNLNGECITKKQCLQCPGPHEYWSCGGACDNVCKDMHKQNQTNCPIVNVQCNEMCYCEKNYARAKNGTCIPIKRCNEPQCGKNEIYEKCPARLTEPQKCSELGWPLPDPCSDDDKCPVKPACVCISGYVRNDKGVCIPKKDCPKCGGDSNAESGCGTNCNKKCEDILKKPGACILICKNNACDCKEGYYYNAEKKKCVLPSECNICTKPNEYLEMCDYECPPNTCESLGMVYACPIRERNKCTPRCKCKSGFLRNKNGECITEEQCRKCKGPHEYWSCGGACDNVCKDMHKQNQTNCPIVNIKCNEMCYCEKDYARAKNGTCIPINKCNEPQCGKNERYEKCPARLTEPQKCSELGWPLPDPCSDDDKCPVKPACVCISGYVRNDKGVCIPKEDCPDCGGDPNAKPGCGINCNKKCEDLGSEPVFCITLCKENSCDCKDGYYYDKEKKKCVPPCECPGVCPGANEAYEDCTNPRCRPMKCSEVGFPLNCTEPPACKKGCACKDGYVRNKKGTCVTLKECGTCGGDKNAESGSGVNCLKKCYDLQYPDKPKPCPKIWKFNACDCKKGFYLDEDKKKCVRARDCPHYCPENEVYDNCNNGGCGYRNCSEIGGPILCIDPIECYGGCTCKEGYLRLDATGKCVPEEKCPESCTKPNEIYVRCPPKCPPQTCKSLNETFHCPLIKTKINESDCIGECRCKENYYRNLIGECIRKEDCLKCTGAHEYFSCGPACDNVCCDLDTKSKDNCPIKNVKCEEMCYCEDGYARDKDGVCICISDCPDRTTTTPKPCE